MKLSSLLALLFCFSSALAEVPVAKKCPDGWEWFQRSRGGWCMKAFVETNPVNQAEAEAKCQAQKAVLAGVQNKEEIKWMTSSLASMQTAAQFRYWIGAKRTKICEKTGITKTCTGVTSFYWTDKSAVGTQGFLWVAGEPNNYGGDQPCAGMVSNVGSSAGLLDDLACDDQLPGYICGKIATFE